MRGAVSSTKSNQAEKQKPSDPSELGCRGVLRGVLESGVAEESRTRGFAAPAFAGCAFVVGLVTLRYKVVQRLSSDQGGRLDTDAGAAIGVLTAVLALGIVAGAASARPNSSAVWNRSADKRA